MTKSLDHVMKDRFSIIYIILVAPLKPYKSGSFLYYIVYKLSLYF